MGDQLGRYYSGQGLSRCRFEIELFRGMSKTLSLKQNIGKRIYRTFSQEK